MYYLINPSFQFVALNFLNTFRAKLERFLQFEKDHYVLFLIQNYLKRLRFSNFVIIKILEFAWNDEQNFR